VRASRRLLDGQAVGEGVPDGGVAGDPLGQLDASREISALEEPFDSFMDEPQTRFYVENGLAHHRESEVAGLDEAGMDRTDGDFIDAGSFDSEERIRLIFVGEWRRVAGVVAHGMPAGGPVLVEDEAGGPWMTDGFDAEEVAHFALETAGREGEVGQARE
jgi:hypothetical protein